MSARRRTRGLLPQTRRNAPVKWSTHLSAGEGEDAVGLWRTTASGLHGAVDALRELAPLHARCIRVLWCTGGSSFTAGTLVTPRYLLPATTP